MSPWRRQGIKSCKFRLKISPTAVSQHGRTWCHWKADIMLVRHSMGNVGFRCHLHSQTSLWKTLTSISYYGSEVDILKSEDIENHHNPIWPVTTWPQLSIDINGRPCPHSTVGENLKRHLFVPWSPLTDDTCDEKENFERSFGF